MDDAKFWSEYLKISQKLYKKYLFKSPPFLEAKREFFQLLFENRRKSPEYLAYCMLSMARCEESVLKEDPNIELDIHSNPIKDNAQYNLISSKKSSSAKTKELIRKQNIISGQIEQTRWRCEFSRTFFKYLDSSYQILNSNNNLQNYIDQLPFTHSKTSQTHLIPFEFYPPLSLISLAFQSYVVAIQVYNSNMKINIANSIRYEMAVRLEKMGINGVASEQWLLAANELLLIQPITKPILIPPPSKLTSSMSTPNATVKDKPEEKKKGSLLSPSPLTALCALKRALECSVQFGYHKNACKNAKFIIEILESKLMENYAGKEQQLIETLSTLFLLYVIRKEIAKSHRTLEKLNKLNGKTSIDVYNNSILADYLDLIVSFEERDLETLEEVAENIFPCLSKTNQTILLSIVDKLQYYLQ